MINPTPLFFRVPKDELDSLLRAHSAQLGPDFLCFEPFYQAVAATWPEDFTVVDIGGFTGVQGWLFGRFRRYVCVDTFDGRRCGLPGGGCHVVREGRGYLRDFMDFGVDTSHDLFLCSAVPDEDLRRMVLGMPNSVVWYPGEPMEGSGPFAGATIDEFRRLNERGWDEDAAREVDGAMWGGYFDENSPYLRFRR